MIRVAISGATGRMGRSILSLIKGDSQWQIVAALDRQDCPFRGRPLSAFDPGLPSVVVDSDLQAVSQANVVIDFSHPSFTLKVLPFCIESKTRMVIGTTGFTPDQKKQIEEASKHIPILIASNMSFGVNLLFLLVEKVAKATATIEPDIEIVEAHHNQKVDAPSGTAMTIKEILLKTLSRREENVVYGRKGQVGARRKDEIGLLAMRGGGIVGEHSIHFITEEEQLTLSHRAFSRLAFARGALAAARFLSQQTDHKLYSFRNVLGIDDRSTI